MYQCLVPTCIQRMFLSDLFACLCCGYISNLLLQQYNSSQNVINASIEFVDIAGLIKGASKGEGLGNEFLSHINSTDVIAHVVRFFSDDDIVHVKGSLTPFDDFQDINLELILSDLNLSLIHI